VGGAVGGAVGPAVASKLCVAVSEPWELVAVNVIVYVPGAA
jgi:hypothetical protein